MLDTWEAEALQEKMGSGRTSPLLVSCSRETDNGLEHRQFVVKALGLPEVIEYRLMCEVIGLLIARMLGVYAPEPALVHISQPFLNVHADDLRHLGITLEEGIGAGSAYVEGVAPFIVATLMNEELVADAETIFATDMVLQNPDRLHRNPNLAMHGGRILAFDFENAFSFLMALFGGNGAPWELSKHGIANQHILYGIFKGQKVDWSDFCSRVSKLDMEYVQNCVACLPSSWCGHTPKLISHMASVVENVEKLHTELLWSHA